MICDEMAEFITALVDNELHDDERGPLEIHLQACAGCREALANERALKREIGTLGADLRAPNRLREQILADRRIFPEDVQSTSSWREAIGLRTGILRPALVTALLLLLALPAIHLFNSTRQTIALTALDTYTPFMRGELPVIKASSTEEIKERLVRAVDSRFKPMGYDLEGNKLSPVAGAIHETRGRKILVAIYQGEGGSLLCYTFLGSEADGPPNAARFFDPALKMNFYAFSRAGINAVLHREGDVICILASEMPMDELLALARSKARPT